MTILRVALFLLSVATIVRSCANILRREYERGMRDGRSLERYEAEKAERALVTRFACARRE